MVRFSIGYKVRRDNALPVVVYWPVSNKWVRLNTILSHLANAPIPYTQCFSSFVQFKYGALAIVDASCKLRLLTLSNSPRCGLNASFYANRSHMPAEKFNLCNIAFSSGW